MTDLDELKARFEAARQLASKRPSTENREAARKAWLDLDAASTSPHRGGRVASRAGRRQAAERRTR